MPDDAPAEAVATYTIQLGVEGKYEHLAVIADNSSNPPLRVTVLAKSLEELMAKVLVSVVLRDKDKLRAAKEEKLLIVPAKS